MITEQCYGVILVLKSENRFLIMHRNDALDDNWTFAKGHHEGTETPKETALRELKEEAGITEVVLLDAPLLKEEYTITPNGEKRNKINEYFVGITEESNVIIQEDEISSYLWATYEEAMKEQTYITRKAILTKAKEYLDTYLNMVK